MNILVDDQSRSSSSLPAMKYPDSENIKDIENQRNALATGTSSSCFAMPYTTALQSSISMNSGLISPPGSRRTSGGEPRVSVPAREPLPSIHEALGQFSSRSPLNAAIPPTSAPLYLNHKGPGTTSADIIQNNPAVASVLQDPSVLSEHQQPSQQSQQLPQHRPRSPLLKQPVRKSHPFTSQPQGESLPHSLYGAQNPKLPSLHQIRTSPPSNNTRQPVSFPPQQHNPPPFEPAPQSAPPNSTFNYSNYAKYSYGSTAAGSTGYPGPPIVSAPPRYPASWRPEVDFRSVEDSRHVSRIGNQNMHGEKVIQQFDVYDLETALTEISQISDALGQFAHRYNQRLAPPHRTDSFSKAMPSLQELDELSPRVNQLQENLMRIRHIISNASVSEQSADQKLPFGNGYSVEKNGCQDDAKSHVPFPQSDPKKRRGRAAPPGRCHSCNRAETPEWRRGPDGARTLCNACGLHYAKLTRKLGTNKAAIASSTLRPKALGHSGTPPT